MRKLFPLFLIIILVVPSSFPGFILSRGAGALGSRGDLPSAPLLLGPPAPWPPSGLYRTRVAVRQPADWARLEELGVIVLERAEDWALVLADEEQLAALARLRFEPRGTDELGMLVTAHARAKPWLAASLRPLLERGSAGLTDQASGQGGQSVNPANPLFSPELKTALAALTSVDDDADGLTNTQEQ